MKRFKKLLVYVGTEDGESLINRAIILAMENGAQLTLVDVIKPIPKSLRLLTGGTPTEEMERLVIEDHKKKLLQQVSEFSDTAVSIRVVVRAGDPATEIIREAIRGQHDLVIKTADSFSNTERIFGSVARSLLRLCPCAVLLLKSATHGDFDNVVAPIDVDAHDGDHKQLNHSIAELAHDISQADDASLHLIAVWDFPMEAPFRQRTGDREVELTIEKHEAQIRTKIGLLFPEEDRTIRMPEIHIRRGSPAKAIAELVEEVEADLLVMGTVCRTGMAGFLIGNTAETVLIDATCSVLALKPTGFICPIEADLAAAGER